MTYLWLGLGLSLLVAVGTLLFNSNSLARPIEHKTRRNSSGEGCSERARRRSRSRSDCPQEDNCVICLTEIPIPDREYLPCFHFFHSDCIRTLYNINRRERGGATCPICRTPFGH